MNDYYEFLSAKHARPAAMGFDPPALNPSLAPWQEKIVRWAVKRGRAAMFEATGLGKTLQSLAWADAVVKHTGKPVLLLTPLAVAGQTIREAAKFAIDTPVVHAATQDDVHPHGITVTNYHKLHHFNPEAFVGVGLGEASILKSFMGKTKQALCRSFADTPYKLVETATPSPNDHMEIGNYSQFLGVMDSDEMLARWFVNDGAAVGSYRLKKHAEEDYWDWMTSWAVAVNHPRDLGYDDARYDLPPLEWRELIVKGNLQSGNGRLFDDSCITATTLQKSRRDSLKQRIAAVAKLVKAEPDQPWLIWCNTNQESAMLTEAIPQSVDVVGSESEDTKEKKLMAFLDGRCKRMISKVRIFGYGLNLQHCRRMAFVGMTFSFEDIYQAVRRCWRFGQTEPVVVYAVTTDADGAIMAAIQRKQRQHDAMYDNLKHRFIRQLEMTTPERRLRNVGGGELTVPAWLKTKGAAAL